MDGISVALFLVALAVWFHGNKIRDAIEGLTKDKPE